MPQTLSKPSLVMFDLNDTLFLVKDHMEGTVRSVINSFLGKEEAAARIEAYGENFSNQAIFGNKPDLFASILGEEHRGSAFDAFETALVETCRTIIEQDNRQPPQDWQMKMPRCEQSIANMRRNGTKVAVCSNGSSNFISQILGALGIEVDLIVGSEKAKKSDGKAVMTYIETQLGNANLHNNCWLVGDSVGDMKCAKKNGAYPILMATNLTVGEVNAKAATDGAVPTIETSVKGHTELNHIYHQTVTPSQSSVRQTGT